MIFITYRRDGKVRTLEGTDRAYLGMVDIRFFHHIFKNGLSGFSVQSEGTQKMIKGLITRWSMSI